MSTMLKTAAMSLLSKTLQTFLSKYLSDVDVEGVALPSVYDGSGWGVRLSNVKLREGVQLMKETPGKLTKTRKVKRKKQTSKPKRKSPKKETSEPPHLEKPASPAPDDLPPAPTNPPPNEPNDIEQPRIGGDEEMDASLHVDQLLEPMRTRTRTTSVDHIEVPLDQDDAPQSPPHGNFDGQNPTTPIQDSTSFFSCFSNGRPKHTRTSTTGSEDDSPTAPDDDGGEEGSDSDSVPPVPSVKRHVMKHMSTLAADDVEGDQVSLEEWEEQVEEDNEMDGMETEDVTEEYEQPYMLCLGDNGRIGTLDIRLVDKELHVMVEDAVLTIEAFPIVESTDAEDVDSEGQEEDGKSVNENAAPISSNVSTAGTATDTQKPATTSKTSKPEPKRNTVGDRVMADIPLARLLSNIPHLFLRDIRVRIIIRNDPPPPAPTEDGADTATISSTTNVEGTPPKVSSNEPNPNDSMLEIGIEFLSVTSGDDALSHFQEQNEEESQSVQEGKEEDTSPPLSSISSFPAEGNQVDNNEYLVRHIRTGRGPSAGISVQLFSPGPRLPERLLARTAEIQWARQRWVAATEFHLLRFSGLDARARIHLGTRQDIAGSSWFYDGEDVEYDESTLDSLLFGMDTVAPGPQLPLPPISPRMSRGDTPLKPKGPGFYEGGFAQDQHTGAGVYSKDANGIQSCKVPSTFHRLARGLLPGSCKNCTHLPSEACALCWEGTNGASNGTALDDSTPMPGLVLQVTLRDPLEINVDRASVETLNLVKTIFVKKPPPAEDAVDEDEEGTVANSQDEPKEPTSSARMFGRFLPRRKKDEKKEDTSEAFASYMQPENIQIVGLHVAKLSIRVEVMREASVETAMSFCYWEILADCLTLDRSALKVPTKTAQDVRLEIGYFLWEEFRGTGTKQLVSLGVPYHPRKRNDSASSEATMQSLLRKGGPEYETPWPTTASVMMEIPPPLETLPYKDREYHGLQLRFVAVTLPASAIASSSQSLLNVRLGATSVVVPWGFWREANSVRQQVTWGILGKPTVPGPSADADKDSEDPKPKSLMKYKVQVDGGNIEMKPMVKMSVPLTQVSGSRSSESGMFLETVFDKLKLAHGQRATSSELKCLSLPQLAALPENVRMRILLCLRDLKPLEAALQVKRESNPFKRTRAVNKGILKMAKKVLKSNAKAKQQRQRPIRETGASGMTRRQEIMSEFMRMDDSSLDELWAVHQRHQRKLARKQQ